VVDPTSLQVLATDTDQRTIDIRVV
jgi:hypothetical protein